MSKNKKHKSMNEENNEALLILCQNKDATSKDVENLLKNGAKITATDVENWTPIHFAAFNGSLPAVQTLAKHNAKNNDNQTPLHLATLKGHQEIVKFLLEKQANPTITDNEQQKPSDVSPTTQLRSALLQAEKFWQTNMLNSQVTKPNIVYETEMAKS